jgi:hypothetical protein
MMDYSAAKFVPANGLPNNMASDNVPNMARPQKIISAKYVKFIYIALVKKRLIDWVFAFAQLIKEECLEDCLPSN